MHLVLLLKLMSIFTQISTFFSIKMKSRVVVKNEKKIFESKKNCDLTQVRSESVGQSNLIKRSGHESMKGGREKERVIVYKSYVELFV